MTINQASLNYTHRDLLTIDADIATYIKEVIPRITDTSQVNPGRLLLTTIAALVDNLNYSLDQVHLEAMLKYARQRANILSIAYTLGYQPTSVSASSVDCTVSMLSGVAGVGGQPIPIYTRLQTSSSPVLEALTMEAATIPEGESSLSGVSVLQGVRVVDEVLTAAASGEALQSYKLSNTKTPHDYVEVSVNGVVWEKVDSFSESVYNDQHYILEFDDDDYTYVKFGDNEFGAIPSIGVTVTVTYIYTTTLNIAAGKVTKMVGPLASIVGVTNPLGSSGGGASESDSNIRKNAPNFNKASGRRIVTAEDASTYAKRVAGVYDAYAVASGGPRVDVYIVPIGGGVASSLLLSLVQTYLDTYNIEGMLIYVHALETANILVTVNVVTKNKKTTKSTVKSKVKTALLQPLLYTNIIPGRGLALSDTAGIIENIDDGDLIDYCDFVVHSRIPRVVKSNAVAPDIVGRVEITDTCAYNAYTVTAISATDFIVSKDGVPQTATGSVGVEYTSNNSEVSFTLGTVISVLTVGNTWTFYTSKYKDNMYLSSDEFMQLELDGDLVINVYYPKEYSITTQTSV